MILVELKYPYNVDFEYFEMPLIKTLEIDNKFFLAFSDIQAYYSYSELLFDLIIILEGNLMFEYCKHTSDKLAYTKHLLYIITSSLINE